MTDGKNFVTHWRWVAGIAVVLVAVGLGIYFYRSETDRKVRQQVIASCDRLRGYVDIEGEAVGAIQERPTPEEVRELIGIEPFARAYENTHRSTERYDFSSPVNIYQIYIVYTRKSEADEMRLSKVTIHGNPYGGSTPVSLSHR